MAQEAAKADNISVGSKLKKIYKNLLDKLKSREITVDGLKFNNEDYKVYIANKAVDKIISSGVNADKLAVFENIEGIIKNAEYVGSAPFEQHTTKNKQRSVIRYDYFETAA